MKTLFYTLVIAGSVFLLASCASTQGDKSDYFGYNNNPKQEEMDASSDNDEYNWSNPLNSEYEGQDNFTVNYDYSNMPPSYIPVVVPWYDSPYNWYHQPFTGVYLRYGYSNYAFYDWYSPFYVHCPVYYNPYVYYGGNRWWDWYPHSGGNGGTAYNEVEKPKKTYKIRDFGPNRGSYDSDGKPFAGGSGSTSGKSSGRTVTKTSITDKPDFDNGAQSKSTIVYKPKTTGSFGTKSDFGKSNTGRSSAKKGYSKDATNKSTNTKYSGFGSSSSGSSGGSSKSGSSGSSSSGSSSSGSSSKSSSSRSSGRSK